MWHSYLDLSGDFLNFLIHFPENKEQRIGGEQFKHICLDSLAIGWLSSMMWNSDDLEMDFSSFPTTLTIIATNIAQDLPSAKLYADLHML